MLKVLKHLIYFYCSWYDKSTKLTANEKDTEALVSVRQFYAFVINGVSHKDVMYSETCLNRSVNNAESCINRTINKVPIMIFFP